MFIPGKDKVALEKMSFYFFGIGMGCMLSTGAWTRYVVAGAFVVAVLLNLAAMVASRRAQRIKV